MIDQITRVLILPNKKIITTYKIFRKIDSCYYNINQYNNRFFKFSPIGEWISCYWDYDKVRWNDIILKNNNIEYQTGFHSFTSFEDSKIIYNKLFNSPEYNLCKCQVKYRLVEALKNYEFENSSIQTKILITRGLKIIREINDTEN